jgi:hypothetical protein
MELIGKLKEKEGLIQEEMMLQNNSKIFMKCKDLFHDKENLFWKYDDANEIPLASHGSLYLRRQLDDRPALHTAGAREICQNLPERSKYGHRF